MDKITRGWPPERRKKQAERCRKQKPWKHNTGPKTEAGKAAIRKNALKHGFRSAEHREFCALLRALDAQAQAIMDDFVRQPKQEDDRIS